MSFVNSIKDLLLAWFSVILNCVGRLAGASVVLIVMGRVVVSPVEFHLPDSTPFAHILALVLVN